jgi:hypothetical protein
MFSYIHWGGRKKNKRISVDTDGIIILCQVHIIQNK